MASLKLNVQNVKCGGCVAAIQAGLLKLPGIQQVEVDIDSGQVKIETTDNQAGPSMESLESTLAELGYPVSKQG